MRKFIFSILAASVLLGACGRKSHEEVAVEPESAIDTTYVRVAVMPTLASLPLYVACERGLFQKAGLKIALVPFDAQMDVDTALAGGSVKGAVTDVFRAERLKKAVSLTYITSTEARWSLITNRAARLNKLEQFGDKMVAMTRYSATDHLTEQTFKDVKTMAPYFKVQINDVNVRLHMIANNEMDGAWFEEPLATKAEMLGHKRLQTAKDNNKYGVIAFRTKYLQKRQAKEFADLFGKVYSESCDSINKYGLANYAVEMEMCCHVDTSVINRLPRMVFTHKEMPTKEVLELAGKEASKQ